LRQQGSKPQLCTAIGKRIPQAAAITSCCGFNIGLGLVNGGEDAAHIFQEDLAGPGQACAARGALEQLHTQVVFQFLDGPRQRRLLDMQTLGGPRKVEFLNYSEKVT